MSCTPPDLKSLTRAILRGSVRGLLANAIFVSFGIAAAIVPDEWMMRMIQTLPASLQPQANIETARMGIWMISALAAAICDLIVHYHVVHDASDAFKDAAWFCRTMATKILTLDTRGADSDKEWAKQTLEGIRVTSISGSLIQVFLGLPLFVIFSLAPWLAASASLPINPWLIAWFVLIKMPGVVLAIAELATIASRTWGLRLNG